MTCWNCTSIFASGLSNGVESACFPVCFLAIPCATSLCLHAQRNLPCSTVLSSRARALSACACRPQPVLFSVRRSREASPGARSDASAPGPPGPAQDNSVKVVVRVRPLAAAEAGEREALQVRGSTPLEWGQGVASMLPMNPKPAGINPEPLQCAQT